MGTSFEDVYDRATTLWTDYRLDNLYLQDEDAFKELLRGFLLNSIDDFTDCMTDLSWTKTDTTVENDDGTTTTTSDYSFDNELSSKEIRILALGTCIAWYQHDMNDVTQFRLHLNVREFKTVSEASNMKQRSEILDKMQEEHDRAINEYLTSQLTSLPFFNGG